MDRPPPSGSPGSRSSATGSGILGCGLGGFILEYAVAHPQLFARGLRELLRGADVIHLHNPPDTLFPVGLLARALGRKVVFDHHDPFPELLAQKFGTSRLMVIADASQRASLRTATAVLCTNRSQAETALARGIGCPERLTVVRNGPRRSTLAGAELRRPGELAMPISSSSASWRPPTASWTFPELLAKPGLEEATLTLVGDGGIRSELSSAFARLGVADRVEFTGQVEHRRVLELIAAADICIESVHPSQDAAARSLGLPGSSRSATSSCHRRFGASSHRS